LSFLKKVGTAASNQSASINKDRYAIYRRHAGLGDLLIGLYYAWHYAHNTKRKLIVDWRWSTYVHNNSNLFPYLFKDCYIRGTSLKGEGIDDMLFPSPFYPAYYDNKTIHEIPYEASDKIYKDQATREAEIYRMCNAYPLSENTVVMNESIRMFPYNEDLKEGIGNFLNIMWSSLVEHISFHINKTSAALLKNKNTIGFHIRLGNNDKVFDDVFLKRVKGYDGKDVKGYIYQKIMPLIELTPDDHDVYITTDTEEAQDFISKLIPNCIMYKKWFAPRGCETHYSPRDRKTQNGLEILRDSLTEMFLLSRCSKIYSTFPHSAFAKVAGLLGTQTPVHFI